MKLCFPEIGPGLPWAILSLAVIAWCTSALLILSRITDLSAGEARLLESAREYETRTPAPTTSGQAPASDSTPAFPTWLLAMTFAAEGKASVAGARCVAAVLAAVFMVSVHLIALARLDPRSAALTMLCAASSLLFLRAFAAVTPAPFSAATVTAAIACFAWGRRKQGACSWLLLAAGQVLVGLSFAAGGPAVLLVAFPGVLFTGAARGGTRAVVLTLPLTLIAPALLWKAGLRGSEVFSLTTRPAGLIGSIEGSALLFRTWTAGFLLLAVPAALPLVASLIPSSVAGESRSRWWFACLLGGALLVRNHTGFFLLALLVPASRLTARFLLTGLDRTSRAPWASVARTHVILILAAGAALIGLAATRIPSPRAPVAFPVGAVTATILLLWTIRKIRRSPESPLPVLLLSLPLVFLVQVVTMHRSADDLALRNLGAFIRNEVPREAPLFLREEVPASLLFYMDHARLIGPGEKPSGGDLPHGAWILERGHEDRTSAFPQVREVARVWVGASPRPYVLLKTDG